jgi:putative ABC transport system permease protein
MARLALPSLASRRATALLTVLAIALSVALLLGVEKVRRGARDSFAATISGTDLIVGARTGDVQLLLYPVFRIGNATANVTWRSYEEVVARPEVAWAVPLSLGDSHRGFRGSAGTSFAQHDDKPFRGAGILAETGTPVDRTVRVSLEAVEAIHVDWRSGARAPPGAGVSAEAVRRMELRPKAVTAALVGLRSRLGGLQAPALRERVPGRGALGRPARCRAGRALGPRGRR